MIDQELFIKYSPELYDLGRTIANAYKIEIVRNGNVASGDLRDFKWDIENTENGLILTFYLPEYWKFIEFGRRPTVNGGNGVVYRQILNWIRMKGIQSKVKYDKQGKLYQPTTEQLACLITRKIHREGYKAKHPLETAMNNQQANIRQFADTAARILGSEIQKEVLKISE